MTIDNTAPPVAGTERETLTGMLDFYRRSLLALADDLTDAQMAQAHPPSDLTLGGLIYHSALVEDHWFSEVFTQGGKIDPWADADWDNDHDWEFTTSRTMTGNAIRDQFEISVGRSQAVLDQVQKLDELSSGMKKRDNEQVSMRFILVHLIEEYARHCGHADLIRESIDGRTA